MDSSVVTFVVNATDNVDGVLNVTCNSTSGNTFFVGDTAVGCTSTDQAGNRAECSFIVRVEGMSYQGKNNAATYVLFVFLKTIKNNLESLLNFVCINIWFVSFSECK